MRRWFHTLRRRKLADLTPGLSIRSPLLYIAAALAVFPCHALAQQSATDQNSTKAQKPGAVSFDVRSTTGPYWREAWKEVYKAVPELVAQHQAELARGLRYHKLLHGDTKKKEVAITFDDGPHLLYTPKLLDILKRHGVKATFFLVGIMADLHPDLVKAEIAAGHSIGNHTYHHLNLTKIPEGKVATEIKACGLVLKGILGRPPHLFRPPGGDYNQPVAEVAEALGYTITLWTDDPGDYAEPGRKVIETRVLSNIRNGGIVLLHDGIQQTLDVLPGIIESLKRNGYQLVTIDEMMQHGK